MKHAGGNEWVLSDDSREQPGAKKQMAEKYILYDTIYIEILKWGEMTYINIYFMQ